jgi:hypothetical protein
VANVEDPERYIDLRVKGDDIDARQPASDRSVREYLIAKAYWLGYKLSTDPERWPTNFESEEDLDYFGVKIETFRRVSWLLRQQGLLRGHASGLPGVGHPTPELIVQFEAMLKEREVRNLSTSDGNGSEPPINFRSGDAQLKWDAFICYATEDKENFVRPLAERLREHGLRIWYDEFVLKVGDSLRRSIAHGLAQSRYGIVVLSPNFISKEWPNHELDGLLELEMAGPYRILPVWHNITADGVRGYSPSLADKVAANAARGIDAVLTELLEAMGRKDSQFPALFAETAGRDGHLQAPHVGAVRPAIVRCPGCDNEMSSDELRAHRIACVREYLKRLLTYRIHLFPKDPDPFRDFMIDTVGDDEVVFQKSSSTQRLPIEIRKIAEITPDHQTKFATIRVVGRVAWDGSKWSLVPAQSGGPAG